MKLRILSLAVLAATTASAQDSFYEIQAAATNDLNGMRLTGTLVGLSYNMTLSAGTGVTVPLGATQLVGIGDDVEVDTAAFGGTLGMFVGSNGWLAAGTGNSTTWAPTAPLFLDNPSTAVVSWTDMSPNLAGSGGVWYSEAGTVATVTFDGVYGFGTTDANTFNLEYDTATGNFAMEWAAIGAGNPEELLIGFGLGGPTADPGQTDISAASPFSIFMGTPATAVVNGSGCGAGGVGSIYEVMGAAANDLAGQKVSGTWNGSSYDVTVAPGTGFAVPLGSSVLTLTDDSQADTDAEVGGTLGLFVGSNGWIATGAGNSISWNSQSNTMLNNPDTGVYAWTDFNPGIAGSGQVYYSEFGTVGRATYNGIYAYGTTDATSMDLKYDTADGSWSIEFGVVGLAGPQQWVVGSSAGSGSSDPGMSDLSIGGYNYTGSETSDLQLAAVGTPIQGAVAMAFDVTTSNIPAGTLSHAGILGLAAPGLPLDAIGMPGCFLNAGLDFLTLEVGVGASGSHTWTALMIPDTAFGILNGFQFNVQSATFGTTLNNFLGLGAITSNGITCTIGDA